MRESRTRTGVVHQVVLLATIDGASVGELDAIRRGWGRFPVVDDSEATVVEDQPLPLLARLAQRLENGGGKHSVTAREKGPWDARVTRTPSTGDPTCVLGVQAVLDQAIVRRLTVEAGGEAVR